MSISKDYKLFGEEGSVYFSQGDIKKINRMKGEINIVSTVCPDYPHKDGRYVFSGKLGCDISLTAKSHLKEIPGLIKKLNDAGHSIKWKILVADLPELVESQREFYCSIAGSAEEYIRRCKKSSDSINSEVISLGLPSNVFVEAKTLSEFYEEVDTPYLYIQENVAENIIKRIDYDKSFSNRFKSFMIQRMHLSVLFRGRQLTIDEHRNAAAHGMSLYVAHGTLLRKIFFGTNLIVVNHLTCNLKNFFLHELVDNSQFLDNKEKFPVGIIDQKWY